jgi:hypothetical protein
MEKRIKAKNPRLAIAAGDHLRWLCHTTQPAKLINQEGNSYPFEQLKVVAHRNYMKKLGMMEKLNSLRKARRAPINTALKRRIT